MLRGLMPAALAAIVLNVLVAPAAFAHADLVSANPGPGDAVKGSRPELVARFSQDLDPSRTRLEVRSGAGVRVANGGEPGSTKREVVLPLPELAPGDYEVRRTSFSSEDGELARGSHTFMVTTAPTPSPSPLASPSPTPSPAPSVAPTPTVAPPSASRTPSPSAAAVDPSTDTGSVVLPIVVAFLVVVVVAGWLLRGRRA